MWWTGFTNRGFQVVYKSRICPWPQDLWSHLHSNSRQCPPDWWRRCCVRWLREGFASRGCRLAVVPSLKAVALLAAFRDLAQYPVPEQSGQWAPLEAIINRRAFVVRLQVRQLVNNTYKYRIGRYVYPPFRFTGQSSPSSFSQIWYTRSENFCGCSTSSILILIIPKTVL